MPNPASAIPLSYKGNDLQLADWGIFLEIIEGLEGAADHRGIDTTVPGLDGQIEGNRRPHQRGILLQGLVKGSDAADGRNHLQSLSSWFDPTSPGDLVADLEDGATYTIRARTIPPSPVARRLNRTTWRVAIELVSIAPDWTVT